jgi:nicotinamide-nucleotide amidase
MRIAFAESCTGGLASALFCKAPGASKALEAAFVAYSDAAKERILGVSRRTLEEFGAVSERTALEMARGARKLASCGASAATTGYAGPEGGQGMAPGSVWVAASVEGAGDIAVFLELKGSRAYVMREAARMAFDLCRSQIERLRLT